MTHEYQISTVTLRVATKVPENMTNGERIKLINRKMNDIDGFDGVEIWGTTPDPIVLNETETMQEMGERKMAEAEAEHERELERQKERYFNRNGHF